jgi:predicted transcriptional regulator
MAEAMVREADRGLAELMIDPEVVRQVRALASYGWGAKRIARELGLARNTVRSYLRAERAPKGERPFVGRKLAGEARREAVRLFDGPAEGNAVVVRTLLEERGTRVSARTVQRAVRGHRDQKRAAERATVRFETEAGGLGNPTVARRGGRARRAGSLRSVRAGALLSFRWHWKMPTNTELADRAAVGAKWLARFARVALVLGVVGGACGALFR